MRIYWKETPMRCCHSLSLSTLRWRDARKNSLNSTSERDTTMFDTLTRTYTHRIVFPSRRSFTLVGKVFFFSLRRHGWRGEADVLMFCEKLWVCLGSILRDILFISILRSFFFISNFMVVEFQLNRIQRSLFWRERCEISNITVYCVMRCDDTLPRNCQNL